MYFILGGQHIFTVEGSVKKFFPKMIKCILFPEAGFFCIQKLLDSVRVDGFLLCLGEGKMRCSIAICDNEPIMISGLTQIMNAAEACSSLQMVYHTYTSGEQLMNGIKTGEKFDLVVIEPSLTGVSGLEIVKRLKEIDESVEIVFCSRNNPYAELFRVRPSGFIHKNYSVEKMTKEFVDVFHEIEKKHRNKDFITMKEGHPIRIRIKDIVYVEGTKRGSTLFLAREKTDKERFLQIREGIDDLYVEHAELYRIHKSYLINSDHIMVFNKDNVILDDGTELSVSRPYQEGLIKRFERKGIKGRFIHIHNKIRNKGKETDFRPEETSHPGVKTV